ncbi:MAG: stage III sporulation protein AA [Clostridiales bacterium GWE2_32_10]|nr:MAG: stage III sporulation protein AA [Clostridiales bacterium GWE2_32_10]
MEPIANYFSSSLKEKMQRLSLDGKLLQEIRLRAYKPVIIYIDNEEFFLSVYGEITKDITSAMVTMPKDIADTLELMSEYSLYSYEEEIRNGYITIKGGHRVGVVGKAVIENNKIKTLKNISGLNIRISHQMVGCADKILMYILNGCSIYNTLIVSPPKCGKTTILRDVARQISDGRERFKGLNVSIVDERSEIAACFNGMSQNDVGTRTDVLDGCPKVCGMRILLRAMSPDVVIVDEIGGEEDAGAIRDILNAGIKVVCSLHAADLEDIKNKKYVADLINEKAFEKIVFLSNKRGIGTLDSVWDVKSGRWDTRGRISEVGGRR